MIDPVLKQVAGEILKDTRTGELSRIHERDPAYGLRLAAIIGQHLAWEERERQRQEGIKEIERLTLVLRGAEKQARDAERRAAALQGRVDELKAEWSPVMD